MTAARTLPPDADQFAAITASLETAGDDPIALVGPNGAGKTNILEAISWLAPGRGCATPRWKTSPSTRATVPGPVSAEVEGALGLATLGTGIEPPVGDASPTRKSRIDRECR